MKEYIKVYSHPRSGTHFLEAFIGRNFYPNDDLKINDTIWGHWSNRKLSDKPNKYGKLFGSHVFPTAIKSIEMPSVYIFRDPRAVAYSIWKTPNFLNPKLNDISFSDFLRTKLDWIGSPAFKCRKKYNIIQHWERHVKGWLSLETKSEQLLCIKYEELVDNPEDIYSKICQQFKIKPNKNKISTIDKPIGLLPNEGIKDSWREIFSESDLRYLGKTLNSKEVKKIFL